MLVNKNRYKNKKDCANLVLDAWPHLYKKFPGKYAFRFASAYIDYCKLTSNWEDYLFVDNQLVACIFCRIPYKFSFIKKIHFIFVSFVFLLKWIFGYFGKENSFSCFLRANSLKSKMVIKNNSKKTYEISLFLVHSNYRNKGYGNKLLEKFSSFAKNSGFDELSLTCDSISNYGFYERNGFKRTFSCFDPVSSFLDNKTHDIFVYKKLI
jgi:GNAT superfamily N-acetyltransferase